MDQAFPDADKRFHNETGGDHRATYTFSVGNSVTRVRVKAVYHSNVEGSFVLEDPRGNGAKIDTFQAQRDWGPGDWYSVTDPLDGRWKLSVHLARGGEYALGVYLT
jgi:hypothetical protein